METRKITGMELAQDLQERLMDLSSEALAEVNSLVMLYDIQSFDHVQDIFIIRTDD